MTLQEFYQEVGGSYDGVMSILLQEKRVYKYLFKFVASDDYSEMLRALNEESWEEAFRFSHNLKGVCLNLGLGSLATTSSDLCELFRHGAPTEDWHPLLELVTANYNNVVEKIGILKETAGDVL